jgi:DNA-binding CsgD family transcriptional regulator
MSAAPLCVTRIQAKPAPGTTAASQAPGSPAEEPDLRTFRYQPSCAVLTRTRLLVAQMVCCGLADKEISFLLGVTSQTVKFHISQIMKLLTLRRRTQIVRYMFETGQFKPDEASRELKAYLAERRNKFAGCLRTRKPVLARAVQCEEQKA